MKKIKFNKRNYVRNYSDLINWFDGMENYFSAPVLLYHDYLKKCLSFPPKFYFDYLHQTIILDYTAALERAYNNFMYPNLRNSHAVLVYDIFE